MSTAAMYKTKDELQTVLYKENNTEDDERSSSQSSPPVMASSSSTGASDRSPSSVEEFKDKDHDSSVEDDDVDEDHYGDEEEDSKSIDHEKQMKVCDNFETVVQDNIYEKNGIDSRHFTSIGDIVDTDAFESKLSNTIHQNLLLLMKSSLFADAIVLVDGNKNIPVVVDMNDSVSVTGFEAVLRCMYSTKIRISGKDMSEIFETAKFLEIPSVINVCREYMENKRSQKQETDKYYMDHDANAIDLRVASKIKENYETANQRNNISQENNMVSDNFTHLKKYHNFLQHRTKLLNHQSDHSDVDSYKREEMKRESEYDVPRLPQNGSNPFQNNFLPREHSMPQLIAPFTMARAAVLAMASQFPRFSNIAAPTPLLPFSNNLQNPLFRPFTETPYASSHATHNQQNGGSGLAEKVRSTNHNLLLELTNKRSTSTNPLYPTTNKPTEEHNSEIKRQKTAAKSSQPKPYKCLVCSAEFNRPANLKTHMRIHSGEKPYRCDACGARFVQVAHLRAHALIHTGEKPYQCKICGTRFRHLQTLKSHIRIHTGEKPYSCNECKVQFRHKSQLRLHLRTKHGINTNTKKSYEHVPGLRSDHISAHIKRTQEMIRVNHQMNRSLKNETS